MSIFKPSENNLNKLGFFRPESQNSFYYKTQDKITYRLDIADGLIFIDAFVNELSYNLIRGFSIKSDYDINFVIAGFYELNNSIAYIESVKVNIQ